MTRPGARLYRPASALGPTQGNAIREGLGETRPRTGRTAEDRRRADGARRADAGSGAADGRHANHRRRAWTVRVSRSRRASRTLPTFRPSTTTPSRRASPRSAWTCARTARAAIDGHVRLLLAWTDGDQPDLDPRPGGGRAGHVVDSLTAVARPARARRRPVPRPRHRRRLPGHPARRGPAGRAALLVDSVGKKARFLDAAVAATGLADTVAAAAVRAEALAADPRHRERWPAVTARAVGASPSSSSSRSRCSCRAACSSPGSAATSTTELAAARRALAALGGGTIEVRRGRRRRASTTIASSSSRTRGRVPPATRATRRRERRPW